MKTSVTSFFILLSLNLGSASAFQSAQISTVHMYIVESQGGSLAPPNHPKRDEWNKSVKIKVLQGLSKSVVAQVAGTSNIVQLPFGKYDIRISAPGFVTETRQIDVQQKESWFMFGIRLGLLELPPASTLTGHVVHSLPHNGVTWVKLVSLYSDIVTETRVEPSGLFVFQYIPHGRYLLLVLHGNRICEKRLVSLKDEGHSIPKIMGERCLMDKETAAELGQEVLKND